MSFLLSRSFQRLRFRCTGTVLLVLVVAMEIRNIFLGYLTSTFLFHMVSVMVCNDPLAGQNYGDMGDVASVSSSLGQRVKVTPKPRVRPPFVDRAEDIPAGYDSACRQEGFSPHPTDCTKFLRCVDQSPGGGYPKFVRFDFDCSFGTVYDPSISSCNFPGLGDTPENCDAKYPAGYEDLAPDPMPQHIRPPRGPDQRGGGHYKFITVTEKPESVDYYYDYD